MMMPIICSTCGAFNNGAWWWGGHRGAGPPPSLLHHGANLLAAEAPADAEHLDGGDDERVGRLEEEYRAGVHLDGDVEGELVVERVERGEREDVEARAQTKLAARRRPSAAPILAVRIGDVEGDSDGELRCLGDGDGRHCREVEAPSVRLSNAVENPNCDLHRHQPEHCGDLGLPFHH